jgi:4-amino-4-deoxy-L-arabinose transferase-like glycosyltransferase
MPTVTVSSSGWKERIKAFMKTHWLLFPVLALAFFFRNQGLMRYALDWDESNVLAISLMSLKDMLWFTFTHDFHPPGLHLSLKLWAMLFGGSDLTLRYFSVFWSVLAVGASYWLTWELSKSRLMSVFTALLMALMPVAIRYSHFITAPAISSALVLFSWVFFLKLLKSDIEKNILKTPWFWLYMVSAFWATQQYASGPYFLIFQGIYFLWSWKQVESRHRWPILVSGLGILALSIPHFWVISQPWHLSHNASIKALHPPTTFPFFFFTPVSLLFFNYDWRFDDPELGMLPPLPAMLTYSALVYGALGWAAWRLRQSNRQALQIIAFVGLLPLLLAYLSGFAGISLFNYRSLLYTGFPFMFLLAALIQDCFDRHQRLTGIGLMVLFVLMQLSLPAPATAYGGSNADLWGRNLQKLVRPGDGIVGYPGVMMLPLMRYYSKDAFGYSKQVLDVDPTRGDNFFNQVDRIDDHYFFVTGDEVSSRPWVRQAFVDFQRKHKRLIYILRGYPTRLMPLVDCRKEMWAVTEKGAAQLDCVAPSR